MNRYKQDIYHRKSIRLKGYDYAQTGAYFVTVCANNRACLFGDISNGDMRINKYGGVVRDEWENTHKLRPNVELDAFVVMPNHIHGIIVITAPRRGVLQYAPTTNEQPNVSNFCSPSQTIGAIIRGYKSAVTKRINGLRNSPGSPVWQRNYYEHVIRDEDDHNRIAAYIATNPNQWIEDTLNPNRHIDNRNTNIVDAPMIRQPGDRDE